MNERATDEWTVPGAEGEAIRASTHAPATAPRAVALLAHGFKGYKDYGLLPLLAARLAGALPIVVHRFNFSHSGVGDDPTTFQRPDLFERDTWNRQVADLDALLTRAAAGELPATPAGLPIALLGHSRGGSSCLLAAGRRWRDGAAPVPRAIVTLAAPSRAMNLSDADARRMREQGCAVTISARTGQQLRIGRAWLDEQLASPADHDILALCAHIACPVLAVHGTADPTVPPEAASRIAAACRHGRSLLIDGGDHVFNTPNPPDAAAPMSPQLATLWNAAEAFLREALGLTAG